MRSIHVIWTVLSFFIAIITLIVIMRYFGVTAKDITDNLSAGLEYVGKMLRLLKESSQ